MPRLYRRIARLQFPFRAVDARRQLCRRDHLPRGRIGLHLLGEHDLPCSPDLGVGGIIFLRPRLWEIDPRGPCPAPPPRLRHRPWFRFECVAPRDLRRLDQLEQFQHAGGRSGLAIERMRGERDRHLRGLALRADFLPPLGRERRLQRHIAGRHAPLVAPRLAPRVGHVRRDRVGEHRRRFPRHGAVGPGRKRHGEPAIGIGHGRPAGDLCRATAERQPRKEPAAPDRKPHLALDPVANLRAGDGQARIRGGRASERYRAIEHDVGRGGGELHLELRSLVFLDPYVCDARRGRPLGEDRPLPGQRPRRNCKRAVERAVGIRLVLGLRHLAAIRIAKHRLHRLAGERGIFPLLGIGMAKNSLVEDDLAGAMDAAVGHDHDRVVGLLRRLLPGVRGLAADHLVAAIEARLHEEHDLAALLGR